MSILVQVIVVLLVLGLVIYALDRFTPPLDAFIRNLLVAAAILLAALWLLVRFGILAM